jgi:hypothetical protein
VLLYPSGRVLDTQTFACESNACPFPPLLVPGNHCWARRR